MAMPNINIMGRLGQTYDEYLDEIPCLAELKRVTLHGINFLEIGVAEVGSGKVLTEPYPYRLDANDEPVFHNKIPDHDLVHAAMGNARLIPPAIPLKAVREGRRVHIDQDRRHDDRDNESGYAFTRRLVIKFPALQAQLDVLQTHLFRVQMPVPDPNLYLPVNAAWNLLVLPSLTFHFKDPTSPRLLSATFPFLRYVRNFGFVFDPEKYQGSFYEAKSGEMKKHTPPEKEPTNYLLWKMIDQVGLAWAAAHFPKLVNIYLIVRSARRKPSLRSGMKLKNRDKFYGENCTYIEIVQNDPDWTIEPTLWERRRHDGDASRVWDVQEALEAALVKTHVAREMLENLMANPDKYDSTRSTSVSGEKNSMAGWGSRMGTPASREADVKSLRVEKRAAPTVKVLARIDGYHE